MTELAKKLIALRKERQWSQEDLGKALHMSQKAVSRLERSDRLPTNLAVLTPIARLLNCTLVDLLPGDVMPGKEEVDFISFCPNPFCEPNTLGRSAGGRAFVNWTSARKHPLEDFDLTHYCGECSGALVTACPACGALLKLPGERFCRNCGKEIFDRPTAEEWRRIERILKDREGAGGGGGGVGAGRGGTDAGGL